MYTFLYFLNFEPFEICTLLIVVFYIQLNKVKGEIKKTDNMYTYDLAQLLLFF